MQDIYERVSVTLKTLRRQKGWSLDKAAEETGVSKAMLGQIERQESSPTIATLWKIASGFRAPFSSFIADSNTNANKTIRHSGKLQNLHPRDKKIRVTSLFPYDKALKFEVYSIELLPGCEHLSPPHKHGVIEHVIVVDGMMEVLLNDVWQPLKKGEGLRFMANQAHGYRNITSTSACFHNIIHYEH